MPENRNNQESVTTAYPSYIHAQDQTGTPGLDSMMDPPACWTQIEKWDNEGKPYLEEYEGRGLLKGKAALITGGDSGIGRSTAILMAREGADITICYLPFEQEDADWTIKHIEKAGRKAHGFAADLRDLDNTKKAVEEHMRVHGRLNILVPNGSFFHRCPIFQRNTNTPSQPPNKKSAWTTPTSTSTSSNRPSNSTSSP
jgi:hypothetical protein